MVTPYQRPETQCDSEQIALATYGPVGPFIKSGASTMQGRDSMRGSRSQGDYELWYVNNGKVWLVAPGPSGQQTRTPIALPATILLQPGQDVSLRLTPGTRSMWVRFDWIHMGLQRGKAGGAARATATPGPQPDCLQLWGETLPVHLDSRHNDASRACLAEACALWWRGPKAYHRANLLLGLFLLDCLDTASVGDVSSTPGWLEQTLHSIEIRLETGLTVAELADEVQMTPITFRRRFKAAMETSAQKYLAERRMQRVRELLDSRPHYSVEDCLRGGGFRSVSTGTRRFRERFGCTPGEYREAENKSKASGLGEAGR